MQGQHQDLSAVSIHSHSEEYQQQISMSVQEVRNPQQGRMIPEKPPLQKDDKKGRAQGRGKSSGGQKKKKVPKNNNKTSDMPGGKESQPIDIDNAPKPVWIYKKRIKNLWKKVETKRYNVQIVPSQENTFRTVVTIPRQDFSFKKLHLGSKAKDEKFPDFNHLPLQAERNYWSAFSNDHVKKTEIDIHDEKLPRTRFRTQYPYFMHISSKYFSAFTIMMKNNVVFLRLMDDISMPAENWTMSRQMEMPMPSYFSGYQTKVVDGRLFNRNIDRDEDLLYGRKKDKK